MSVGFPAVLWLHEFGSQVWAAFGAPPYHVGSSAVGAVKRRDWFDVDVVVILDDEEYERMGFGPPERCMSNGKWVALCLAFSVLGTQMTGLPIDFKIQQQSEANRKFDGPRSAIGLTPLRCEMPASRPARREP